MKTALLALGVAAILIVALASTAAAQLNENNATYSADLPDPEGMDNLTTTANATKVSASTISVMSTATTQVEPDKVIILLAVETVDQMIGNAVEANSLTVNDVIDALLEAGADENETSTSTFAIYPNYDYNFTEFGYPEDNGEVTSYTVANTIQIESTDLENVGSWIDVAIGAGANRVDSVVFALSEEMIEETKADLIPHAVENAEARAEILASALDSEMLGLKEAFLEDYDYFPSPYEFDFSYYGPSGTPIIPPKQTVSMTVHLTYWIQ